MNGKLGTLFKPLLDLDRDVDIDTDTNRIFGPNEIGNQ